MKIQKQFKIEKVASRDEARPVLNSVHINADGENAFAVATDGKRLAVVPIDLDSGDLSGENSPRQVNMPLAAIKAARKFGGNGKSAPPISIQLNGEARLLDGSTHPYESGTYPNWKAVMPSPEAANLRVTINAKYLFELAEAIGSAESVTLHIEDSISAIRVTGEHQDAVGVLMPRRKGK